MYFIALIVMLHMCTISTGSKLHAQTTSISGPVIYVGSTCSAAETETTPVITSSTSSSPEGAAVHTGTSSSTPESGAVHTGTSSSSPERAAVRTGTSSSSPEGAAVHTGTSSSSPEGAAVHTAAANRNATVYIARPEVLLATISQKNSEHQ